MASVLRAHPSAQQRGTRAPAVSQGGAAGGWASERRAGSGPCDSSPCSQPGCPTEGATTAAPWPPLPGLASGLRLPGLWGWMPA